MNYRLRFLRIAIASALVVVFGTVGYALIEGWSWLDAVVGTREQLKVIDPML